MSSSTKKDTRTKFTWHNKPRYVDESATMAQIQTRHPSLFFNRDGSEKHLARDEVYYVYRGFVIIEGTVQFTGCQPEKKVSIFSIHQSGRSTTWDDCNICCRPEAKSVQTATEFIDKLLDEVKTYRYGVDLT